MPYLELRTTIGPTPAFLRRIHYMAASLQSLGGRLADHELIVSVGSDRPRENLYRTQPWSNLYPLAWRWVDRDKFVIEGYKATNADRYQYRARSNIVMLVDADVLFIDEFSDLLAQIEHSPAICGVTAHVSPFMERREFPPSEWWRRLAAKMGSPPFPFEYEHTGWTAMFTEECYRRTPVYFNGGMIAGPAALMEEMFSLIPSAVRAVTQVIDSYFLPQLARTLAIYKADLPHRAVGVRYNFPNDPRFALLYPEELTNVRLIHYLRKGLIDRDRDFQDAADVARLARRDDLQDANERLRIRLSELQPRVIQEEHLNTRQHQND
jgi:hypothetical protein